MPMPNVKFPLHPRQKRRPAAHRHARWPWQMWPSPTRKTRHRFRVESLCDLVPPSRHAPERQIIRLRMSRFRSLGEAVLAFRDRPRVVLQVEPRDFLPARDREGLRVQAAVRDSPRAQDQGRRGGLVSLGREVVRPARDRDLAPRRVSPEVRAFREALRGVSSTRNFSLC